MDIAFKSVTKNYGLITALKDVTFRVKRGDFILLTGPSGSGKTTIFKIVLGEIKPTQGNIIINKTDISSIKKRQMEEIRKKIGVIFQDYQLVFDKTVEENIALALDIIQYDTQSRLSKIEKVLKTVGLLGRRYLFPSQLSGGELQRTALARALAIDPEMILADEPMGNLDEVNALNLIELFKKINLENQTTIIMATHNPYFISKLDYPKIEIEFGQIKSKPETDEKETLLKTKKIKKTKTKKNVS